MVQTSVYDTRDSSHQSGTSPSLYYSLTHTHRSIGYRIPYWTTCPLYVQLYSEFTPLGHVELKKKWIFFVGPFPSLFHPLVWHSLPETIFFFLQKKKALMKKILWKTTLWRHRNVFTRLGEGPQTGVSLPRELQYTFPHPLFVYRGKNVQRVKRKLTETSLIIKLYVIHKHPVRLPLSTCSSPSTITSLVKTYFYTTNI